MSITSYTSLSALKTKTPAPANGETAYLAQDGRAGVFVFNATNLSTKVSIDTPEGIYVAPSSTPSGASGAWVRQLPRPGEWHVDWFGVPGDPASGQGGGSEIQSHTELSAVVSLANLDKPARIVFGAKIYTLGNKLPTWTYQVELAGSVGPQGTILVKRYVESSVVRGVLSFANAGFTVRNLNVRATSGSGGAGISAALTLNQPNAGLAIIEDCIVSGGSFFNWSVYCNGSANTGGEGGTGPKGYRGFYIRGGQFFGAKEAVIGLTCVQHFFFDGVFAANSPYPATNISSLVLQASGDATIPNDDFQVHGVLAGDVNLNWVTRSVFVSPQNGTINVDANCTGVKWYGPTIAGSVNNSAGTGFVRA